MQGQLDTPAEIAVHLRTHIAVHLQKFVGRSPDVDAMTRTVTETYERNIRQLVEKIDPSLLDRVKVTVTKGAEPLSLDVTLTGPRDLMEYFAELGLTAGVKYSVPIS